MINAINDRVDSIVPIAIDDILFKGRNLQPLVVEFFMRFLTIQFMGGLIMSKDNKWPKIFPPLTPEQKYISDDFMKYWHEVLANKYGIIDIFNHKYVTKHAPISFNKTLEIGAGIGEHLDYEKINPAEQHHYYALELRVNMAEKIRERHPGVNVIVSDCQTHLDYPDHYFDRIIAIHVLEHLPDLPAAIKEMYRLISKPTGFFQVVIPCEGGFAYSIARKLSAQRIFEKRYKQSYKWFIEREHLSTPQEIIAELEPYFEVKHRQFFPLLIPAIFCNLAIGLTLQPKNNFHKAK